MVMQKNIWCTFPSQILRRENKELKQDKFTGKVYEKSLRKSWVYMMKNNYVRYR